MIHEMMLQGVILKEMENAWGLAGVDYKNCKKSGNPDIIKHWLNDPTVSAVVLVGTEFAEMIMGDPYINLGRLETFAGQRFKLAEYLVPVFPIYSPFMCKIEEGATQFYRSVGQFRKNIVPIALGASVEEVLVTSPAQHIAIDTEGTAEKPWCATIYPPYNGQQLFKPTEATGMLHHPLIFHSALHDVEVLKKWTDRRLHVYGDTLVAAYHLGLPLGLKELTAREVGVVMTPYQEIVREALYNKMCNYWTKAMNVPEFQVKQGRKHSLARRIQTLYNELTPENAQEVWNKWNGKPRAELREQVQARIGPLEYPTLEEVDYGIASEYAKLDPIATYLLHAKLIPKLKAIKAESPYMTDLALVNMISDMRKVGMPISLEKVNELATQVEDELNKILTKLKDKYGQDFNPASPDDTVEVLQAENIELTKRTPGGKLAAGKIVLKQLAEEHEVAADILRFREVAKLKSTYVPALIQHMDSDQRIRPVWRTTNTDTGRLSCSEPNIMAFPARTELGKKFRDCFVAPDGWLYGNADLEQIEMRIIAEVSKEQNMIDAIKNGLDLHTATASLMFKVPYDQVHKMKHRYPAKVINFLMVYEGSARKLMEQMSADGIDEPLEYWQDLIDKWYAVYPRIKLYQKKAHIDAEVNGFVQDMWGRIRHVEGARSVNRMIKSGVMRKASNFPIQSAAQVLIKRAMVRIDRHLQFPKYKGNVHCVAQIHDELVFILREGYESFMYDVVKKEMEGDQAYFSVPISSTVGIHKSWGGLK